MLWCVLCDGVYVHVCDGICIIMCICNIVLCMYMYVMVCICDGIVYVRDCIWWYCVCTCMMVLCMWWCCVCDGVVHNLMHGSRKRIHVLLYTWIRLMNVNNYVLIMNAFSIKHKFMLLQDEIVTSKAKPSEV